jgi:hypothetical protein
VTVAVLTADQRKAIPGIAAAAVYTAVVLWFGATQLAVDPAVATNRLHFVLGWLLLPGLYLMAVMIRVMLSRFVDPQTFDGSPPPTGSRLDIDRRVLQNTLEQVVLAAIGWVVLAMALPSYHLGVIPVLAVSFVFARLCFWIGYRRSPPYRAFGFAATFLPTFAAYVWTLLLVFGI